MNGTTDITFSPEDSTTRAMMATIIWRLEGSPVVEDTTMLFEDVASDKWYTEAIRWGSNEGVVLGYTETEFAPYDLVTREQFAAMLYRYYGSPVNETTELAFEDSDTVSEWAKDAMIWAVDNGILNGRTETTLAPTGNATRVEVATMIMRYMEMVKISTEE